MLPAVAEGSAAWGDYDNDGKLDILLTGSSGSVSISKIYRNEGNGVFTDINAGLTGVFYSCLAWGDYDNDGKLDILLAGDTGSSNIAKIYQNDGNGVFTDIEAGLTGVAACSVAWGDYNNDGALDILLTGNDSSYSPVAKAYQNDGGDIFTDINAGLTGVYDSSVAWGDYDNDGAMDILLTGDTGSAHIAKIYHNNATILNTVPSAPSGPAASVAGANVTLSWNAASDTQTPAAGLSYNLRVGTTPGGSQIAAPMAAGSGYRRVPQLGNANLGLTATLKNLAAGTYYWSVQAVDTAWAGSAFSDENSFTVTQIPMTGASIDGRAEGVIQVGYSFVAMVSPVTATQPITFVWKASGQGLVTHTNRGLTDTATFTWNAPGTQVVTVTASSALGTVTGTHLITMNLPSTDTRLVVDTTVDSNDPVYQACTTAANDCSLRGAISKANADTSRAYSVLLPAGIYTLTLSGDEDNNVSGDLDIKNNLTILGAGADATVINSNQLDRVLYIQSNTAFEMSGVKVTGGKAASGGGIYVAAGAVVTLTDTAVISNTAFGSTGNSGEGGGIYNAGTLTLTGCTFHDNTASGGNGSDGNAGYSSGGTCGSGGSGSSGGPGGVGRGGGLYNTGILALNDSTLTDNMALGGNGGKGGHGGNGGDALFGSNGVMICAGGNGGSGGHGGSGGKSEGGGIYNAGVVTATVSTLSNNVTTGASGGDGGNGGSGGDGNGSGFGQGYGGLGGTGGSGNQGDGGAVYITGTLTLANSTVTGNVIGGGSGGSGGAGGGRGAQGASGGSGGMGGSGAGFYNQGTLTLVNTTITNNAAGRGGNGGRGGDGSIRIYGGVTVYRGGDGGNGGNGGNGGGIFNSGTLPIVNVIISHNSSGSGGPGGSHGNGLVPNDGAPGSGGSGSGLYIAGSSPHLRHTTIARNAGGDGSGVYVTDGSTLALTNTILVSHTVGISITSDSTAMLETILWGSGAWANGINWVGGATVSHEYTGVPAFVNPDSGNYHIGPTSEAIDKGVNAGVTTDIDNQPRPNPNTGLPDLGADEYWVCAAINEVDIAGPVVGTPNTSVAFTAILTPSAPTPYIRYTWWPEPVTGQGTAMVTYTFGTSGDYLVYLSAQNCGGSRETSHIISVVKVEEPVRGVTISGATTGKVNTAYTFTATVSPFTATTPITYTWLPTPDSGQGTAIATYTWLSAGAKAITVTAANVDGAASGTHGITISAPPGIEPVRSVTLSGPTIGVTNTVYTFTAMVSPLTATTPITYTWSPTPGSGQGTAMATYTWLTTGTKTITITAANGGGGANNTHAINIVSEGELHYIYLPLVLRSSL
jgi:hypothetical protein